MGLQVRSMTVAAMVTSGCDQGDSTCQEYGVVGLANLRNTCYLNSVIQALMSSTKLQQHYGNAESWIGFDGGCLESGLRECFQAARKKGMCMFWVWMYCCLGLVYWLERCAGF